MLLGIIAMNNNIAWQNNILQFGQMCKIHFLQIAQLQFSGPCRALAMLDSAMCRQYIILH